MIALLIGIGSGAYLAAGFCIVGPLALCAVIADIARKGIAK
jgi:hypothetical protein